jgi:hypothetical protein
VGSLAKNSNANENDQNKVDDALIKKINSMTSATSYFSN